MVSYDTGKDMKMINEKKKCYHLERLYRFIFSFEARVRQPHWGHFLGPNIAKDWLRWVPLHKTK